MILIINSGSSSIKFALYRRNKILERTLFGQITRIGLPGVTFTLNNLIPGEDQLKTSIDQDPYPDENNYASAIIWLMGSLEKNTDFAKINAIGHRLVHGMQYSEPSVLTPALVQSLKQIIPYDPDHLPTEIRLIEAFREKYPSISQFACFDTAFHRNMPPVAHLLPIPRRFERLGIRRYGFHGLSYNYLMKELEKVAGRDTANGRVVLAHLGSGASLAAVRHGKSMDTSMGFTPASGLPMSTRCGDLDPGAAWFMMKTEDLSPDAFNQLINHQSGLLGVSETTGDMQDLLQQEATDTRSADAVDLFCYQVKKGIGAFAAALGGIDALVFAGGIGEKASVIRSRICDGLQFLGIELDKEKNNDNIGLISSGRENVAVHVIQTDEEWMIAQLVSGLMPGKADNNQ